MTEEPLRADPRPARIVFASDTPGHTAGYHVVARALRDAGFEVILLGPTLPQATASTALEEDAALIAYRIMDRDPVELVTTLFAEMREREIGDVPVLVGGIVGKKETRALVEIGVAGVFGPGSKLADIVACARQRTSITTS